MDPVPVNMRTWTTFNYVTYWISDSANVATWSLASSMLAVGLSWYEFLYPVPRPWVIAYCMLKNSKAASASSHRIREPHHQCRHGA